METTNPEILQREWGKYVKKLQRMIDSKFINQTPTEEYVEVDINLGLTYWASLYTAVVLHFHPKEMKQQTKKNMKECLRVKFFGNLMFLEDYFQDLADKTRELKKQYERKD